MKPFEEIEKILGADSIAKAEEVYSRARPKGEEAAGSLKDLYEYLSDLYKDEPAEGEKLFTQLVENGVKMSNMFPAETTEIPAQ